MPRFYSQNGEDVILHELFKDKSHGFFVEVGCIDGKRFSNTLSFEERGWKGLCIEAHAGYIELLRKNRPGSIIAHCAAGEKDEDGVVFYANSRGSLSTLDASKEKHFQNNYGKYFSGFKQQQVIKRRLDSLFRQYGIQQIDILSLDIEGYEVQALLGIDFHRYKPWVLVVESDGPDHERAIDCSLSVHGYTKIHRLSENLFYLADTVPRIANPGLIKKIRRVVTHTQHPLDRDGDKEIFVELDPLSYTILVQREQLVPPARAQSSGKMAVRDRYKDIQDRIRNDSPFIVDAGANVGNVVDLFLKQYASPRIHAFEPNPYLVEQLKRRFCSSSLVNIHSCALGSVKKDILFHIINRGDSSSVFRPTSVFRQYHGDRACVEQTITVPMARLDEELATVETIDVMKLDLQGYELEALKGCGNLLKRIKIITTEIEFAPLYEGQPLFSDIDGFLRDQNFYLLNLYELWTHPDGQLTAGDAVYLNSHFFPRENKPFISRLDAVSAALSCKGWTDEGKLSMLFDLVQKVRSLDGDVLEIGSAWGRSTVLFGLASHKQIWSIDPHTGGIAYINKGESQNSYEEFLFNISRHGISARVTALKMTTQEVVDRSVLPESVRFSLMFIDGLHTPEGIRTDFTLGFPRLEDGGIMVFDDYFEPSVSDYAHAIDALVKQYELALVKDSVSRLVYFQKSSSHERKLLFMKSDHPSAMELIQEEDVISNSSVGITDPSVINAYTSDPENHFLVSFPRTGSHWLRMLMELYFGRPSLVRAFYYPNRTDYLTLHTHDMELQVYRKNIIYLYRDPVDTIYSQICYHKESPDDLTRIRYWSDMYGKHLYKWLCAERASTHKTVITYEALKRCLDVEFAKLTCHFGQLIDLARLEQVARQISKEEVKRKTTHDQRVVTLDGSYLEIRKNFRERSASIIWEELTRNRPHLKAYFDDREGSDQRRTFHATPAIASEGQDNQKPLRFAHVSATQISRDKKIVALVPARNEKNLISLCLRALSRYTDAIVYLDDFSGDGSVGIVESMAQECRVERLIRKTEWYRNEPDDRNALLRVGREIGGTHFIVIDADELFTATCLDQDLLRNKILALRPGDKLELNWIQLWRNINQYRFDQSVWTWNYKDFAFADDGKCSYSSDFLHTPRTPWLSGRRKRVEGYQYGVMHFQFVNWRNLLVKQAWYRCLERIRNPQKPVEAINQTYAQSSDENNIGLKPAPQEWFTGYEFFTPKPFFQADNWREAQVLAWFEQYGTEFFADLEIWCIDWGAGLATTTAMKSNLAQWQQMQERNYFEIQSAQLRKNWGTEKYEAYYGSLDDLRDVSAQDADQIQKVAALSPDMTAVVIGCGYGRESKYLAKNVRHVYGIDVSERILDKANAFLGKSGITNFTGVLAENWIQIIPPGIDLVYSITVFQHITRDMVRNYIKGLSAKLSPRGSFLVQFAESASGEDDPKIEVYEPNVSWTVQQIRDLVQECGLTCYSIETQDKGNRFKWHWTHLGKNVFWTSLRPTVSDARTNGPGSEVVVGSCTCSVKKAIGGNLEIGESRSFSESSLVTDNERLELENRENAIIESPVEQRYLTACFLAQEGRHINAITVLQEVIATHHDHALAHNDLGVLYLKTGDHKKALNHYKQAVRLQPGNDLFRKNLADFYFQILGKLEDSATIYTDILSGNPRDLEALIALGQISMIGGLTKTAYSYFSAALDVEPSNEQLRSIVDTLNRRGAFTGETTGAEQGHRFRVSAIVSTYNAERFIRGRLEDLEAQTIADQLEVIVVDSGSEQNEMAIVEELQKRYSNIRYVRTNQRESVYQSWNRGIKAASGKYITNANTDDRLHPDALNRMAKKVLDESPECGVVYSDSLITKNENATWDKAIPTGVFRWPDFNRRLLHDVCFMGPCPMWRRDLHNDHGYFDESYRSAGDYEFWLRLSNAGVPMIHLRKALGLYLENPKSVSLSEPDLSWQESERARNVHWKKEWGKRPGTRWLSFRERVRKRDYAIKEKSCKESVLIACDYFWPSVGGVELFVEDLACRLMENGIKVEIAARFLPDRNQQKYKGFLIHQFRCSDQLAEDLTRKEMERFKSLLTNGSYKVVLVVTQPNNWVGASLTHLPASHPRIILFPSINADNAAEWQETNVLSLVDRVLRSADEIISVSESGYDVHYVDRANLRSKFIPHAVDQDASPKNFRSSFEFSSIRPLLVMVANFWPVKNHLALIHGLENLVGDWQLAIIGHPIEGFREYFNQVCRHADRDHRIRIIKGLPREQAAAAIRDADLVIVPSKGESAGPLVILQAMSYGTPWIATPECNAVRDEAGGIITPLEMFPKMISTLLSRPRERAELGRLGQEHWQTSFTWEKALPAYLNIIAKKYSIPNLRMPKEIRNASKRLSCSLTGTSNCGPENSIKISVVIPTYNRSPILTKCLDALARQTLPSIQFEVLVCDDGSTDNTRTIIKRFKAPFELSYQYQSNRGPAAARNMGIRKAIGKYLLILNDDAILEPNALALHLKIHEEIIDKKVAVLGRFSLPPQITRNSVFGYILENSDALFYYYRMKDGELYDFNHFYTCNISIRREAVLAVGLFDEDFTGPAAEDLELGYRLSKIGYTVLYSSKIVAWHDHAITPEGFLRTHKVRGQGAVTLMIKQPQAPFYPSLDFTNVRQMRETCERQFERVPELIKLLDKIELSIPKDCDLKIVHAASIQLMVVIRLLMQHAALSGMLSSPMLPKLIELRSRKKAPLSVSNQKANQRLVSVIIPCFNYARYLAEAVASVISQTYQDFEIIIVNDGSTDHTKETAAELVAIYSNYRITVLHQENSGQPAISRNNGIREAAGEYILPLDADDILDPSMIQECMDLLEHDPTVAIAYTDRQDFDGASQTVAAGDYDFTKLRYANQISYCALFRKEVWTRVGGYRTNVKGLEDWDFWIAAGSRGFTGRRIPKPLFKYRRHDRGVYQEALRGFEGKFAQIVLSNREAYDAPDIEKAYCILGTTPCEKPEVSVVIPTFNRPDMLAEAVRSVLTQTFQNLEIIVVNDAGMDVASVIKRLGDGRISYVSHSENRGLAAARNTGIRAARGTYIALLDDDDLFYPEHLETAFQALHAGWKVAYTDAVRAEYAKAGGGYERRRKHVPYSIDFDRSKLLIGNIAPVNCFMFERETAIKAGLFDETFSVLEDWEFWLRLSAFTPFHHIKKPTVQVNWRVDGTTMTSSRQAEFKTNRARIYQKYQSEITGIPNRDAIIQELNSIWSQDCQEDMDRLPTPARRPGIVSIVILTFNQLKYTKECIESIRKYTPEQHEIIFVDNGSTDGTKKWLRKLAKDNPHYKLINNKKNLGFSKGCNQGIAASSGEHILLLNNDVVVTENWLAGMLECLNSASDIGIVGPMTNSISGPQKVPVVDYTSVAGLAAYARAFRDKNRHRRIPQRRVVGFCMLLKSQLIEEVGLLDESFGSGNFEDDDLCLRASLAGYRNVIAGDVFVHHYGSRTFIGNKIDYGYSLTGNRKIFVEKWSGKEVAKRFGKKILIVNAVAKADDFFRQGDIEKATASLLEAIKHAPDDRGLYFNLVEMLIDAKRYDDALGILASVPQRDTDARQLALVGYCEEGLDHNEKAQENADRALAIEGSMAQALNIKGVVAYNKGALDTAEDLFRKAVESAPEFGESYTNLGALKWAAGEHAEALDLFERGFILSPTVADVITAYRSAVDDTGAFARAEPLFREAKDLHPNDKRIAFFLIAVLIQQQKHELAMQEIEQAMMRFGIDEGILKAALEIRGKTGPLEVCPSPTRRTLSVCMIVKNEELNLSKCLTSVKPVADEIIVVDTGSTDKTKAIASALGARVFDFPWTNDFSEARNYSLSKASGDWILVLDADEMISSLDHASLRSLIQKADKRFAYNMTTRNYTYQVAFQNWTANDGKYLQEEAGSGWLPSPKVRLFVSDKRVRFVNAVHELVEPTLKDIGIRIKSCSIPVHHYGRLSQDRVVAKGEEYYRLGKKKALETKGDYKALLELAIQASEIGKFAEAIPLWENLLKLSPKDAVAHLNLGYAYIKLSRYDVGLVCSQKALELDPNSKEAGLNYAGCELIIGDVQKAIFVLDKLLQENPDYPPALARLAAAYIIDGQREGGLKCLERLRLLRFDSAAVFSEQARAFLSQKRFEKAMVLLEAAIETKNMNTDTHLLLAECHRRKESHVPPEVIGSSEVLDREPMSERHA